MLVQLTQSSLPSAHFMLPFGTMPQEQAPYAREVHFILPRLDDPGKTKGIWGPHDSLRLYQHLWTLHSDHGVHQCCLSMWIIYKKDSFYDLALVVALPAYWIILIYERLWVIITQRYSDSKTCYSFIFTLVLLEATRPVSQTKKSPLPDPCNGTSKG